MEGTVFEIDEREGGKDEGLKEETGEKGRVTKNTNV